MVKLFKSWLVQSGYTVSTADVYNRVATKFVSMYGAGIPTQEQYDAFMCALSGVSETTHNIHIYAMRTYCDFRGSDFKPQSKAWVNTRQPELRVIPSYARLLSKIENLPPTAIRLILWFLLTQTLSLTEVLGMTAEKALYTITGFDNTLRVRCYITANKVKDDDLMFPNATGTSYSRQYVHKQCKELLQCSPQDLRRAHIALSRKRKR